MTTEVVDRLYGLPLEEFTPQRDLAARELRRGGDRDAAGEIAKLPKPTPAAWTANQVAREQPELIEALLEAGEALRDAQEEALAGGGGRALRDAMATQQNAVDAMMAAAQSYRPAGRALSRAMSDRLRTTLQAAAGDEALSAALAAGRLVDEAAAGGAWPLGPEPEGTEVVGRRRAKARAETAAGEIAATEGATGRAETAAGEEADRAAAGGDAGASAADEAAAAAAREAAERARAELEEELRRLRGALRVRERSVAAAEEEAGRAREAATAAAERLAAAQQAAEDARAEAEAAAAAAGEARESLQAARDDVARLEERLD
jgi:hypothetical protein